MVFLCDTCHSRIKDMEIHCTFCCRSAADAFIVKNGAS